MVGSSSCISSPSVDRSVLKARRGPCPGGRPDLNVESWLTHRVENIAALHVSENTIDGYRVAVYHHLIPGLGAHRLTKLEPEHLERFCKKMQTNGSSAGTAHQAHGRGGPAPPRGGQPPAERGALGDRPDPGPPGTPSPALVGDPSASPTPSSTRSWAGNPASPPYAPPLPAPDRPRPQGHSRQGRRTALNPAGPAASRRLISATANPNCNCRVRHHPRSDCLPLCPCP